jgi:ATP-dependent helicase HepA
MMEMVLTQELGNSGFSAIRQPGFKAGNLLLESVYVVQAVADRVLHAERYLPPTTVRVVMDMHGKDWHASLPHEEIQSVNQQIDKDRVRKIVASYAEKLREMLNAGENMATGKLPSITSAAKNQVKETLVVEIDRLKALQEINPSVRDDEIEHLQEQHRQVMKMLDQAVLRLEALRVLVTV